MKISNYHAKLILKFFICFALSLFVVSIPYFIGFDNFSDRDNYVIRAGLLLSGSELGPSSWVGLKLLVNEPLWAGILIFLSLHPDPDLMLTLISFLSAYIILYFVITRVNPLYAILIVTNPVFIDLINSQIRTALAMSFLLLAVTLKRRVFSIIFAVLGVGTHTVAYYLIFIYHLLKRINNQLAFKEALIVSISFGVLASVFFAFGLQTILSFVGDRRADISVGSSSLLYSGFWFLSASLIFIGYKNDFRLNGVNKLIALFIVFLMTQFLFNSIFGLYGSRFLAIGFPFLFICISLLRVRVKLVSLFLLFIYQSIQLLYWW
ncbi:hypothetical protein [Colwellia psychrerythraea]|uniref:EpsG family protein n=1 Tax=Colwellia psychrerythraea TaxID=28229 RepID=A0A099KGI9_COLPS|nr:hypothetical protein [Colwellia psychrerythraea]KGJ89909.1 hypothetical protein GAB14E_3787 [Colwellia psychrerythraea]